MTDTKQVTTTNADSHDSYHPSETTTVPIEQSYHADNASTSENHNDASSVVDAGSSAVGSNYGDNVFSPDLSAEGVSVVLSPSVSKVGTAQGGLTTSTSTSFPWTKLLVAGLAIGACVWYLHSRRVAYGY